VSWAVAVSRASAFARSATMNVHRVTTGVLRHGRSRGGPAHATDALPSLPCSRPATKRRAETGYAASAFFEGDFSDFFDESEEESAESLDFDSDFSPPSLPDRSISRLRRFVP
jgi:hypothetical protein